MKLSPADFELKGIYLMWKSLLNENLYKKKDMVHLLMFL